ncbi:thermonuclease family protein [Pedobacter sp. ASV12]|uniref:thermonuclease family protein n=1 Tax=Pedobacter sp. ASV12 TaxID=2795120 RepID=UPI0018EAFE73|nr:thermonuclease family protein [Pedobacter sp. ASV12]
MWLGKTVATFLICCCCPLLNQQKYDSDFQNRTFTAKVIRIMDGDTLEVLYQQRPIKLRLAHIDCPEQRHAQPFGTQAKKALSDLCFGQQVKVQSQKYDRYRRLVAIVTNQQHQIVNQEMIKLGMAWHFVKYSADPVYAKLEQEARKQKIGVWQDAHPVAPWEWRKLRKRAIQ